MRILTDEQHAQIVEALTYCEALNSSVEKQKREALATLQDLPRLEVAAICAVGPNVGVTVGWYPQVIIKPNEKLLRVKDKT